MDNNETDAYTLARIALALCGKDEKLIAYQKEVVDQIHNPPVKSKKKGKDNGD